MQDILLVSVLYSGTLPIGFHHPSLSIRGWKTSYWWAFSTLKLFQWVFTIHHCPYCDARHPTGDYSPLLNSSSGFPPSITVHTVMQDILLVSILHSWTLPVGFHLPSLPIPWCKTPYWWVFSTLELFQWMSTIHHCPYHDVRHPTGKYSPLLTLPVGTCIHHPSLSIPWCKTFCWLVFSTLKLFQWISTIHHCPYRYARHPAGEYSPLLNSSSRFPPSFTVHTVMQDIQLVSILHPWSSSEWLPLSMTVNTLMSDILSMGIF